MDCTSEFVTCLASRSYASFNEFSDTLKEFEQLTCTRYMKRRSKCFAEEAVERQILVYKAVEYACILRGNPATKVSQKSCGTLCSAGFAIRYRHGVLRVVKYSMIHNHDKSLGWYCENESALAADDSDLVDAAVDLSVQFREAMHPLRFSSFYELQAKIEKFQKSTGSLYVMRSTKRFPEGFPQRQTLVYRSLVFECYHFGTRKSFAKLRPHQRTAKIGCRSRINVYCKDNELKIMRYDVRHNHEVTLQSARLYPKNRRLDKEQQLAIQDLLKTDPHNQTVKEYIEDHFDMPVTMYDVKNLRRRFKEVSQPAERLTQEDMFSHINPHLQQLEELALSSSGDRFWERLHDVTALASKWRNEETHVMMPSDPCSEVAAFECAEVSAHSQPSSSSFYRAELRQSFSGPVQFRNSLHNADAFRGQSKCDTRPISQLRETWPIVPSSVKNRHL